MAAILDVILNTAKFAKVASAGFKNQRLDKLVSNKRSNLLIALAVEWDVETLNQPTRSI